MMCAILLRLLWWPQYCCYSIIIQEANHFTVAHSVSEITYHVSQWAAFNKRNKFSNAVKSLLATSDARLVCSIAEVSKHRWLIKRGAYYRECIMFRQCQSLVIKCVVKVWRVIVNQTKLR